MKPRTYQHCADCGLLQRTADMHRRGVVHNPPVYVCTDPVACAKRAEAAR